MNPNNINESDVISFLLHAQPYIKKKCIGYITQYKAMKADEKVFTSEMKDQFESIIRGIITDEVTKNLACDASIVNIVLNDINIEGFLDV